VRPEQEPFARRRSELSAWQFGNPANIGLPEVVRNAKPTVLIGASGQPGAFTEEAIRAMAKNVDEITEEIRKLPDVEKLRLVDTILSDLDKPDPEIDQV